MPERVLDDLNPTEARMLSIVAWGKDRHLIDDQEAEKMRFLLVDPDGFMEMFRTVGA